MADIKSIQVDGIDYAIKDETARNSIGDLEAAVSELSGKTNPIQRVESLDENNMKTLRDLETGSYVLYGYFRPYAGASNYLPFDNLLVNVYHVNEGSHLFEFSTANSEVNFIEILVDATAEGGHTYSRTAINMLELIGLIGKMGNLNELTTTEKGSIVAAINSLAQAVGYIRVAEISLPAASWAGEASPYSQVVNIPGITEYSQVDLTPSVEQLAIFHDKDLSFVAENEDGVVTVYAIGDKPTNDYTMQVTIKEVAV